MKGLFDNTAISQVKNYAHKHQFFYVLYIEIPCTNMFKLTYCKIPQINPRAYIFQRPFLRGLFLEGLIYGEKFASQNRLG